MNNLKKNVCRVLCAVLSFIFITDPLTQVFTASAAEAMSASRAIVDFIEDHEGFSQYQYMDTYGPSIGYGTNCEDNEFPDGVTEEQAEQMLLEYIYSVEEKLNSVIQRYGLKFSQNEYDALVSLSYNIGTNWIGSSRLYQLLINGNYTLEEFINAFGIWCHIGTTPSVALIKRRIKEINIFLYGCYQGRTEAYPPVPQIVWVIFDPEGGSVDHDVQFYQYGEPFGSFPTATVDGVQLTNWCDENDIPISVDDIASDSLTLYPYWGSAKPYHKHGQDTGNGENEYGVDEEENDGKDREYYDELINTSNWVNPFKDAESEAWYYSYVCALTKAEIVSGYPDGSFKPNGKLTCGEALKLILGAAELDGSARTDSHWASGYYSLAINNGIISFIDIYSLDDKIDRGLVAKIVARSLDIPASNGDSPFADTEDPYVVALYNEGILTGSTEGGKLVYRPDSNLTRAEVCAIVWRMMTYDLDNRTTISPAVNSSSNPSAGSDDAPYLSVPSASEGYEVIKKYGKFEYSGHIIDLDSRLEGNILTGSDFLKDSDNRIYSEKAYACGIDVSAWQGDIDWEAVAADGIDYAIIRVGYRGYSEGGIYVDQYFHTNITGAINAGLDVGVYFYSQATTVAEACEEAVFTLSQLGRYDITYPVVFDWEPVSNTGSRTARYTTEQLTACTKAFCETIESAGYKSAVYFNRSMAYLKFDLGELCDYDFWLAEYVDMPTLIYAFDMWQYTSSASVDGISGNVDMNLCFKRYEKDWM